MSNNPTVTITLPFFNNVASIRCAVLSVLNQSFTDWELILVDDGSTDGSDEELAGLNDPRIVRFAHATNRGQTIRLNEITRHARGRFIARMDGDDVMHPERLQKQVAYLLEHPSIDLVATPCIVIDRNNRIVGMRNSPRIAMERRAFLRNSQLAHPSVMARRDFFVRHPYDERFTRSHDRELWCRSCVQSRFFFMDSPLLFYREDNPTAHRNYSVHSHENRQIIRQYGPTELGWRSTALLLLGCVAKQELYRLACAIRLEPWWKRRRNGVLSCELQPDFETALAAALTPVNASRSRPRE